MRTLFILLILISNLSLAQYYSERTIAQNFEQSEIYFKSHYLNPYGLAGFKNISAGFIDNPFLNLKINPANLSGLEDRDFYLYLDFRGDRTEAEIVGGYVTPYYFRQPYYSIMPDRRWLSISRSEPEPIVSLGLILRPLSEITKDFYFGGSYQFIRKNEKYYEMPYGIYVHNYYYDALGVRSGLEESIPIIDRYSGKDEMTNNGHFFSLCSGYGLTDDLKIGLGLNGVVHSREGEYLNSNQDEYGNTSGSKWNSIQSQEREQKYNHFDLSFGIKYNLTKTFSLGTKAGYLKGVADQLYASFNSYLSEHNKPFISSTWYRSFSDASTYQTWEQKGGTRYAGFDFQKVLAGNKIISGYYLFSSSDNDLTSTSLIKDTSNHSNRWDSNPEWYASSGYSAARDIRSGFGERKLQTHEAVLNIKWNLNENTTLSTGLYINHIFTDVASTEPASVYRISEYTSNNWQNNRWQYFQSLKEEKTLVWKYNSEFTSIQIPVLINFNFSDKWSMMLGISRVANAWNIEEETTAYFQIRERTDLDSTKFETNFGERYNMPKQKISEDFLKFLMNFNLNITKDFSTRLMFEPEFSPFIRVAQWWLSFETKL